MLQGLPSSQPKGNTAIKTDPMLAACRDLAVKMLTDSLDHFFSKLEDTYFELGDKSFDRKQREDFYAARLETHNKRELMARQFQSFMNEAFDKGAIKKTADNEKKFFYVSADPDQLSLVANEEYEESISADKVVKSIKTQGGDELTQLELRLARLLPENDGQIASNPMSPEAICEAFLQACRQLETGVDARMIAMQAFEKELSGQVANVYHQINQYLIAQNVQPLPRSQRAKQQISPKEHEVKPKLAEIPQLANHLSQLANHEITEQETKALETLRQAPSWLAFLDLLQRKAPSAAAVDGGETITQNLLGLLRETGWAKQLPQLDAMTLELVAMLFEHIFEDPRLSPSVKSLIGRLQIPVLKVGMMDADFFASKKHPARLLLDELAFSATDNEQFEVGMPRYEATAEIVNSLIKRYEKDICVFDEALHQLQVLNQRYEELAAAELAEEVEQLAAHELAELSHVTSEQLIAQHLSQYESVPDVIHDFLTGNWLSALKVAYGPLGECEPEYVRRISAMNDLLWSVQPKATADDRFKMVNMLPVMLKALEDGVAAAGLSKEHAQAFFSELVQCHASAIRNGIKVVSRPISAVEQVVETSSDEAFQETVPAYSEDSSKDADSILPIKGEWVEWLDEYGHISRLRLSWISPQQTRFLFTSREVKGMAFLKPELECAIKEGRIIRLALEGSITDRAIQGVMKDLC